MEKLETIKEVLVFISKYDVEVYDIISILEEIEKSSDVELKEWREHLITNYIKTELDDLTILLIDKKL